MVGVHFPPKSFLGIMQHKRNKLIVGFRVDLCILDKQSSTWTGGSDYIQCVSVDHVLT